MNIRETLLQDKVQSKATALRVAAYACLSAKHMKALMKCFLNPEYRVAQRAAWSVTWAARTKPELIHPYLKTLVEQLGRKDVHAAVIRNSVRVLQDVNIPQPLHAEVMNACFKFIESNDVPVAIKAFSLTTLDRLSAIYPDIRTELQLLIQERWDKETAAFHARARKILGKSEPL